MIYFLSFALQEGGDVITEYIINRECYKCIESNGWVEAKFMLHSTTGVEFPREFWSALSGRSKFYLLFAPKSTLFVLFDLLFDCWQVGDLLFNLTYGLAVVHFDFWVWDRNPDIWSKSYCKLVNGPNALYSV